jgi:hypothetical protein
MDLTGLWRAMKEARGTWLLVLVGLLSGTLIWWLAKQGLQQTWFAAGNFIISAGYLTIVMTVAPYFKVDADAKLGAIIFFLTCSMTHVEMGVHTLADSNGLSLDDLTSWHMLAIHTVQPVALWRFVFGLQSAAVVDRDLLPQLERDPDQRTRSDD